MEIPSVVDSELHSASGAQIFTAQELNPEIPALSEEEDHCDRDVPPQEQSSPLGNDEKVQNKFKELVCQGNAESQETRPASLISGEAPVEVRPPTPDELCDEDPVSYDSCCSDLALPVSAPEGLSDHVDQNTDGQTLPCEPKGYLRSLESSPALTAHPNGPDAAQNFLPVPRIVKHKQSSITFSDCAGPPDAEGRGLGSGDPERDEEKGGGRFHDADGNDDSDDDVFDEIPVRRELFANNGSSHRKMRSSGSLEATRNCGCAAVEEVCCSLLRLYTSIYYTLFRNASNVISCK